MTDPHELPATFFSATEANPPPVNGALKWTAVFLIPGIIAWIALVASLIALGLAVAK